MEKFIQRFEDKITGKLSGFDRLVFRGTLRRIAYLTGMKDFLWNNQILLKDFGTYALNVTEQLKEAYEEMARKQKKQIVYLNSSKTNKEEVALKIAAEDNIQQGSIGILSCVEPCKSYEVHRDKEAKRLELRVKDRKCLHYYHYFIDPEFGFMNARIETWFPFNIQICLNGREWLARKMDRAGLKYQKEDNCFPRIEDAEKAQKLMDQELATKWPSALDRIARLLNPIHNRIFKKYPIKYYWSVYQSEWATDIMFKSVSSLQEIYPGLVLHGITHFSSPDVMRFLGRKLHCTFDGEIVTSFKNRPEGVRVKHWLDENSIKLYDKGSVLRAETTINNPSCFKVFRPKENDPQKKCAWQRLRKGVADLHRRSQISEASNERYLDAFAPADTSICMGELLKKLSAPTTWQGYRVRALRTWDPQDLQLIQAVNRGEFSIHGFRNRDLQGLLYQDLPGNEKEKRSRCSRVSRLLRMLRAHHLIHKVPRTHRYHLTPGGHQIISAVISTRNLTLEQLNKIAA